MSMNKVILMGRLTKDIEVEYLESNKTMRANFILAVGRKYAKQGEEKQTDFIPIVAWGKTAEFASKYFKKGTQVYIVGNMQIRNWNDQNGQKRYITEVIAEELGFAEGKMPNENVPKSDENPNELKGEYLDVEDFSKLSEDDLPF